MRIFFLLYLFVMACISCSDDDHSPYYGSVTALKNGELWSTDTVFGYNDDYDAEIFGIKIYTYNEGGHRKESFGFSSIPKVDSTAMISSRLNQNPQYYHSSYVKIMEDVFCDWYDVDETQENIITIDFDESTNEFSGTFSVIYVIRDSEHKCNPNAPDTIKFTNGEFHSRIKE